MIERFIHHVRVERPDPAETVVQARERLGAKFSRNSVRRMTHLGLLVGGALDGAALGPDDALVYVSTFAETRALEDFLMSFPAASPLLFQTSIHPGAIQQVLIARQQPLARLWPLASCARLVEQALLTALLEPTERVMIAGGEERGTWMLDYYMASTHSFALALGLTREDVGAFGRVIFEANAALPDEKCLALDEFAMALAERRALHWHGGGGRWSVEWR